MNNEVIVTSPEQIQRYIAEALRTVLDSQPKAELMPEVMTLKQLCEYWQVSQPSINLWILEQGLPVHYVGGDPRFHRSEVDQWSKENSKKRLAKRLKAA